MENSGDLISTPLGVFAVLCLVAALFFYLQVTTKTRLFDYVPPLLFIYATPIFLNNFDVIPSDSPIYGGLSNYLLPAFIVLMLIKVNVPAVVRVMGKGVLVMLMGTVGVMAGAVVAYVIVHPFLSEDAWKGYGALTGSWIGGTANMAATAEMLGTSEEQFGLAIIADNVVYIVWLPLLLLSRDFATRFNTWARVPEDRLAMMDEAAEVHSEVQHAPTMPQYLFLVAIAVTVTWIGATLAPGVSEWIASVSPGAAVVFSEATVRILLVTTIALLLSATPVSKLPNSTAMGTALIYIFTAGMGARASVAGLAEAPVFVAGAFVMILVHGLFCLAGAWLFRVDVHSVAIASAANIGAAASAPIVAAHHRPSLVPASILMALLGYAMGNYLAPLTGHLARWAAGQ